MSQIKRTCFTSVEQFSDALSQMWNVEVTQSDPGPAKIKLSATTIGDCHVYSSQTNLSLLCAGQRTGGMWTISPIVRSVAGNRYRGQKVLMGETLLLDPGGDVYQQIGSGHQQDAISIPVGLVEKILQAEHKVSVNDAWRSWSIKSDPRSTVQIYKIIWQILARSSLGGSDVSEIDLAGNIIALVQETQPTRHAPSSLAHRRHIVRRGEELIRGRLDDPPSITELCEATHTSRRLLFYAFKELLGRSPREHAKVLRLHAARRQILARKDERCVQQVGLGLGFWHPGQFAIDYATLFGESPSQTRLGDR